MLCLTVCRHPFYEYDHWAVSGAQQTKVCSGRCEPRLCYITAKTTCQFVECACRLYCCIPSRTCAAKQFAALCGFLQFGAKLLEVYQGHNTRLACNKAIISSLGRALCSILCYNLDRWYSTCIDSTLQYSLCLDAA